VYCNPSGQSPRYCLRRFCSRRSSRKAREKTVHENQAPQPHRMGRPAPDGNTVFRPRQDTGLLPHVVLEPLPDPGPGRGTRKMPVWAALVFPRRKATARNATVCWHTSTRASLSLSMTANGNTRCRPCCAGARKTTPTASVRPAPARLIRGGRARPKAAGLPIFGSPCPYVRASKHGWKKAAAMRRSIAVCRRRCGGTICGGKAAAGPPRRAAALTIPRQ